MLLHAMLKNIFHMNAEIYFDFFCIFESILLNLFLRTLQVAIVQCHCVLHTLPIIY